MAKREISGTLRNLKFMQRAVMKDEKKKNDDEELNGIFTSLSTVSKKCVVITDGDPQPGALVGRMSFQSFNPSIEKLNEEALNGQRTDGSTSNCSSKEGKISFSKTASCLHEPECSKIEPSVESNADLKRKQSEGAFETHYPTKFQKKGKGNVLKHQLGKKVDWCVLKPSKLQTK